MAKMASTMPPHSFETIDVASPLIRILAARQEGLSVRLHDACPTRVDHGEPELGSYASYAGRLVGRSGPSDHQSSSTARMVTNAVLRALPDSCRVPPSEARTLHQRHGCNSFGINGPGGQDVACASFVGFLQLFNHSCQPNAVFDHATVAAPADATDGRPPAYCVVALQDIPSGQEICISYLSFRALISESAEARRAILMEHYGFECMCGRCSQGADSSMMDVDGYAAWLDSVMCPNDGRGCGTGVGVPAPQGLEHEATAGHAEVSGGSAAPIDQRRCVHCARTFSCRAKQVDSGAPAPAGEVKLE